MNETEFLGALVKQARDEKNWSQQDLADTLNLDVRTVKTIENGFGNPDFNHLCEYIDILDISASVLFSNNKNEQGLFMDRLFRQLIQLSPMQIKILCDSAIRCSKK